MAVWLDVAGRLERGLYARDGLHVGAIYHERLPAWLGDAWADAQAAAGGDVPALVINYKGCAPGDVAVIMKLSDVDVPAPVSLFWSMFILSTLTCLCGSTHTRAT